VALFPVLLLQCCCCLCHCHYKLWLPWYSIAVTSVTTGTSTTTTAVLLILLLLLLLLLILILPSPSPLLMLLMLLLEAAECISKSQLWGYTLAVNCVCWFVAHRHWRNISAMDLTRICTFHNTQIRWLLKNSRQLAGQCQSQAGCSWLPGTSVVTFVNKNS